MIWLLVALCWIISFLFAGIEAGLLALDPVRLRHRAKSGDRGARRLQEMLKEPDRLLITVLLVTNAADITAGLSFPPRRSAEVVVPPFPLARGGEAFRFA